MLNFQPKEPKLDFLEKARLWKFPHITPLATVTYDTRSGSMFDFFSYLIFLLQIIPKIYL